MSTILKNVLRFTGLLIGIPAVLSHRLNVNGIPVIPQIVIQGGNSGVFSGFLATADATNVTVTRQVASSGTAVDIYVEHWHTIEAVVPLPGQLTGLVPFVASSNGSGSAIQHVQDSDSGIALPGNGTTNVLSCSSITGDVGSYLQFTGMLSYQNLGNTLQGALVIVELKEDGEVIATTTAGAAVGVVGDADFDLYASIPIAWWIVADGSSHTYTIDVTTDSTSDGVQSIQDCAVFVNNLA